MKKKHQWGHKSFSTGWGLQVLCGNNALRVCGSGGTSESAISAGSCVFPAPDSPQDKQIDKNGPLMWPRRRAPDEGLMFSLVSVMKVTWTEKENKSQLLLQNMNSPLSVDMWAQ